MATVYLIHFSKPIGNLDNPRAQAQHYIGYADSLKKRLARHRSGNGAAILRAVQEQGIEWEVVRTWPHGTRKLERKLKNRKKARQLCPVCKEIHE